MPRLPNKVWEQIRAEYESGAAGVAALARTYDVTETTVRTHRDNEGWVKPDGNDPIQDAVTAEGFDEEDVDVEWGEPADRVAELEAELAAARAELSQFKPVEVPMPVDDRTAAELLSERMNDMVEAAFIEQNRERAKNGLPAMTLAQYEEYDPGWVERTRQKIITETVADLTRHATSEGQEARTMRFVKPDGVTLVQIPLELGIGNFGLSPHAFFDKLKKKGFKEATPRKCLRSNCEMVPQKPFEVPGLAEAIGVGGWLGYCSDLHFRLDPYAQVGFADANLATTTASFGA